MCLLCRKSEGTIVIDVHRPVRVPDPLDQCRPPVCVMDILDGEFLKPVGIGGDCGVQDENQPPERMTGRPLPDLPESQRSWRTATQGGNPKLLPKVSNAELSKRQAKTWEMSPRGVDITDKQGGSHRSERNLLLSHQGELTNIVSTTYKGVREVPCGKTTDSSQTVPKSAEFSSSDSAYGSHGDQRTSGSSLGTSDSDSSRERKAQEATLLTTINELEEAVVQERFPLEGDSEPRCVYDKWDPNISIITRMDSARSLFYNTQSTATLPGYNTQSSSPPLYNTQAGSSPEASTPQPWTTPYGRQIRTLSVDCNTLNDFCDESYPVNTSVEDAGVREGGGWSERGGGEQMCSLPVSALSPVTYSTQPTSSMTDQTMTGDDTMSSMSRQPLRVSSPQLPTSTTDMVSNNSLLYVCNYVESDQYLKVLKPKFLFKEVSYSIKTKQISAVSFMIVYSTWFQMLF